MDFKEFEQLGWSQNEIKVYIYLVEAGSAKVGRITRSRALPRTTIYGVLKSLLEKGMVSYTIKSGVKYFAAAEPKYIVSKEEEKIKQLKSIIPSLENIKHTAIDKPRTELYEGKLGIKTLFEDMLKNKSPIYGYGNTKLIAELLEYYFPQHVNKRVEKGIPLRLITEHSKASASLKQGDKKALRKTRFLDRMKDTSNATYIYDDKVAIISLLKSDPTGILIQDKEVHKTQKTIFEILWDMANDR